MANDIDIIDMFYKAKSLKDLAIVLNKTERHYFPAQTLRSITGKDLNYLTNTSNSRYKTIRLPKKNGSDRLISIPDYNLKRVQSLLGKIFTLIFQEYAHYSSNGFLLERNICRNAKPHIGKRYVYNIDIQNFFPSISFRRIKTVLELKPFNLTREREPLAFQIANLVTLEGVLPQGAPTSPIFSNIVCQRLDRKLTRLANRNGIKYSRYADDITFSSNKNIFNFDFNKDLRQIIELEENFNINESKTRIRTFMDRQIVTGLVVNSKLNIKREYVRRTRSMLSNWEKKGLEYAQQKFKESHSKKDINFDFRNSLRGHIDFIGLVRGKEDPVYIKMKIKFEYLFNKLDFKFIDSEAVRNVLLKDNKRMELILVDNLHDNDTRFVSFCTSAFHQIENLLNYYYWKRFPNIGDFKQFMFDNNPAFKKRWKTINNIASFKKISDFDINLIIYLFEKEHFYNKRISYNRELTMLREIRNDNSHRSSIDTFDKGNVKEKYNQLKLKWKRFQKKHNRYPQKTNNELEIENQMKLIEFIEAKNYRRVRSAIKRVIHKIKLDIN